MNLGHFMSISANELRGAVYKELERLGFTFDEEGELIPPIENKELIKELHRPARIEKLGQSKEWIEAKLPLYKKYFANGSDIDPLKITPKLIEVKEKWHNDLFRLARYYWSLPYSFGFGRRLRFLIIDENNNKLIGIFGLQSPPICFPSRDILFDYPSDKKTELINQTMDIFTLGALPPYARLLGGKLVALATVSNEVRNAYKEKYYGKITEMEGRILPANLVALTTTSAFGRSSIYNRLKYNDISIAESIGYTKGYGNFHFQRLYPQFKAFLDEQNISVDGGYGTGPKRTWQLIRKTLNEIDISEDFLKHGIRREAFLFRLIDNLDDYMEGRTSFPIFRDFPFTELSAFWKERWLLGRAERVDGWHKWESKELIKNLIR